MQVWYNYEFFFQFVKKKNLILDLNNYRIDTTNEEMLDGLRKFMDPTKQGIENIRIKSIIKQYKRKYISCIKYIYLSAMLSHFLFLIFNRK